MPIMTGRGRRRGTERNRYSRTGAGSGSYAHVMDKGDAVADFELPDQNGTPRRLSELLRDGPVVLFFYPAALTYGCTKESCHFRDLKAEFNAVSAQRVGISADTVEKQKRFADKHEFDYPLLSDSDSTVADQFGVKRSVTILGKNKRATFVIGTDQRVLDVVRSELSFNSHADRALEVLRERAKAS